ncbi:MAG: NADPH-dependent FMN reductase [Chitinophagaceae bacterium]
MSLKLLAINGSIRKNSTNEFILKAITKIYENDFEIRIFDQLDELPYFNPDLVKSEDAIPAKVKNFYSAIENADGILICTPEYVFSLPGVLKNALEWTVSTTLFSYKPFAFIIASASGEKAFESLDLIMKTLLQVPVEENCKLLIKGGRGKINEAGEITDKQTEIEIRGIIDSLRSKIKSLKYAF